MPHLQIQKKVLELTRKIPHGRVVSYKEVARKLKSHPRAVARALASNPFPIKIPCHRVVYSDGRLGGYTPSGQARKMWILKKEGIKIVKGRIDKGYFYYFK